MEPATIAIVSQGVANVMLVLLLYRQHQDRIDDERHDEQAVQSAHSTGFTRGMSATLTILREFKGQK